MGGWLLGLGEMEWGRFSLDKGGGAAFVRCESIGCRFWGLYIGGMCMGRSGVRVSGG